MVDSCGLENKKTQDNMTTWGGSDVLAAQKAFLCLKEASKQTLWSLLASDMLDIASNSMLKSAVLSPVPQ